MSPQFNTVLFSESSSKRIILSVFLLLLRHSIEAFISVLAIAQQKNTAGGIFRQIKIIAIFVLKYVLCLIIRNADTAIAKQYIFRKRLQVDCYK